MEIIELKVQNVGKGVVTDDTPRISFAIKSERRGAYLKSATVCLNGWQITCDKQIGIRYDGAPLKPMTEYSVKVEALDNFGETDEKTVKFSTGRLGTPWKAKWITDGKYKFNEKRVSPVPMVFRKKINTGKKIAKATVSATALGIYKLELNGKKLGNRYFAPGFTTYKSTLLYQIYDISELLCGDDELVATVAGGWAVGSFVMSRQNRITAPRQAFLAEINITYVDGSRETVATDESWEVSLDGPYKSACIYDGETYDSTVDIAAAKWRPAAIENVKITPRLVADDGAPVVVHEVLKPVSVTERDGETIYDFGQNIAGVVHAKIKGGKGQQVVFRHAEILKKDGGLFCELLRSAKATATYICSDGENEYSPEFTYMGFRYVGVTGVKKEDIELEVYVLTSDIAVNGSFKCSNELINKLQENILRSARSNFMDIPTDCPQRDERMGWTGDIAVFAPTACYNYEMTRFLEKWLRDLRAEQSKHGGIPNTVPRQGYGFPTTMPLMAIDFWGDAALLVPWAEYIARGDIEILKENYDTMKRYVDACRFWAGIGVGKHRYIWHTPAVFHFGDWIAPDVDKMSDWQKRSKYTATASLRNTSRLLSQIATLLGFEKDARKYKKLSDKVANAYVKVFTDGKGKMKNEFQTGYVLPLAFDMFPEDIAPIAAKNLAELVKRNDYCIATGFPGTPYILFVLADNGQEETAFKMLTNTKCPSWLFEVKAGGTNIWERWDALKEDGSSNLGAEDGTGGMVSFNHYASGAVGDFLYRRIAGIQPLSGGYKSFEIKPLIGGGITSARGAVNCPYGEIVSDWKIEDGKFKISVSVPCGAKCILTLPSGRREELESGVYDFTENYE